MKYLKKITAPLRQCGTGRVRCMGSYSTAWAADSETAAAAKTSSVPEGFVYVRRNTLHV